MKGHLRAALTIIDALCGAGAWVGAVSCLCLSGMLIVEVVTTSFFNWSQPWAVEYSTYFQAMVLFAGTGWAFRQGAHIRVALLLGRLPPGPAWLLDLVVTFFALGLCGYVTTALIEQAARSFELGSESYYPSATPLVYPQSLLAGGFVLLTLAILARALRLLIGDQAEAMPVGERPATID